MGFFSDVPLSSPLKELLLFGPELLVEFSLCVADPRLAAQRLGFEAEPRLARAWVGVVAQRLPRRAHAHVTRGGFGALARAEDALKGNPVGLLRGQPAQNADGLAGVDQCHLNWTRCLNFGFDNDWILPSAFS